jgi:hypothetical protein
MKHVASRDLYAYWQAKRGLRAAPERADIEPAAIRSVLGDAFIVALDRDGSYPIRLAGTRLCALFDREIKGESFLDLWEAGSRRIMAALLAILAEESTGTIAAAAARNTDGEVIDLELLLLPLACHASCDHGIGVLAPLIVPKWLGASPVGALILGGRRHIGADIDTRLIPRFMAPRRRPELRVYKGGRSTAPIDGEVKRPPR